MTARLRSALPRLGRAWISWASFKLGLFVGAIVGMTIMAVAMAGLKNAGQAKRIAAHYMERPL